VPEDTSTLDEIVIAGCTQKKSDINEPLFHKLRRISQRACFECYNKRYKESIWRTDCSDAPGHLPVIIRGLGTVQGEETHCNVADGVLNGYI
jgi:hypothetical protein